jgi:hypothetical protein
VLRLRLPAALLLTTGLLAATASPALAQDAPPAQPMQVGTALAPGNSGLLLRARRGPRSRQRRPGPVRASTSTTSARCSGTGSSRTAASGADRHAGGAQGTASGSTRTTRASSRSTATPATTSGSAPATPRASSGCSWPMRPPAGPGTFAELVGPSGVPADVQRALTYSRRYDAMFAAPPSRKEVFEGYAAGIDAGPARAATPRLLPASTSCSHAPERWTVTDTSPRACSSPARAARGDEFREVGDPARAGRPGAGPGASGPALAVDEKATVASRQRGPLRQRRRAAAQRAAVLRKSAAYALALPARAGHRTGYGCLPDAGGALRAGCRTSCSSHARRRRDAGRVGQGPARRVVRVRGGAGADLDRRRDARQRPAARLLLPDAALGDRGPRRRLRRPRLDRSRPADVGIGYGERSPGG